MEPRFNLRTVEPAGYKAVVDLDAYVRNSGLQPLHYELIKIRASQINGCSYCIDLHTKDARRLGETERRIYALSAWRETPFFSPEERAILALTEEITLITGQVSETTWQEAIALFDESYIAKILMAAVTINAWNRIGVATKLAPTL
ncbi:carboxymuconolactone decarboxylase family protein [Siphonobacter aquaeclarae]|uniref:Alkylhydroperoxidase AhpD family core domain-containing protein n=1 Tax=Siphonobacter aquaeclarae TaxID=563176 RepID=A0A1G9YIV0_9BACT|nr:carboxymuconolactone decarboxylase family protein [Siphonobacter aquaeclarae]SDN08421.1 alkylhydroperoxidase AhpD family core domain-containing protein [Siphonobacter aquaeclarae]